MKTNGLDTSSNNLQREICICIENFRDKRVSRSKCLYLNISKICLTQKVQDLHMNLLILEQIQH